MTPKSIGFQEVTYVVNICDMIIVEFVDLEKIDRQTNKPTNKKQTNQRRRKDYSHRATITNKQTKDRQTNGDEKPIVAVRL